MEADASPSVRSNNPPPRLHVGVIGTGRAGSVLGAALNRAGHKVVAGYGVSDTSRLRAEALLPGVPLVTVSEVFDAADLVLIAVPDDALEQFIAGVVAQDYVKPGQILAHVSGRYGIGVFAQARSVGALPVAIHPAMTLTGTSLDLERLSGAPFGVTAPEALRPIAEALVVEMGGEAVWVPEESRTLYHAALANGANHLVTLVTQSIDLLEKAGVEEPSRLMGPLLSAALDNALRQGDQALTGPVARGDATTVAAHIDVIGRVSPEAKYAYIAMARLTADRAIDSGLLNPTHAEQLLEVLADASDH